MNNNNFVILRILSIYKEKLIERTGNNPFEFSIEGERFVFGCPQDVLDAIHNARRGCLVGIETKRSNHREVYCPPDMAAWNSAILDGTEIPKPSA